VREDLGGVPTTGDPGAARRLPVSHSRLPRRQRLEYINRKVAELLEKLRVEFTKSRPRHSNDNGLVETKNGAIVRKHLGYAHIPQHFAAQVNASAPST